MNFAEDRDKLFAFLTDEGYTDLRVIDDKVCGLGHNFMFTTGLMVGLTDDFGRGYERRYCFEQPLDAYKALAAWDGKEHPGGPWIKLKGEYEGEPIDLLNPELKC